MKRGIGWLLAGGVGLRGWGLIVGSGAAGIFRRSRHSRYFLKLMRKDESLDEREGTKGRKIVDLMRPCFCFSYAFQR